LFGVLHIVLELIDFNALSGMISCIIFFKEENKEEERGGMVWVNNPLCEQEQRLSDPL